MLEDYSRYILAWKLTPTMAANDVQETLEKALAKAKLDRVRGRDRPRCSRTTARATFPASSAASWRRSTWSIPAGRPTTRKPQVLLG